MTETRGARFIMSFVLGSFVMRDIRRTTILFFAGAVAEAVDNLERAAGAPQKKQKEKSGGGGRFLPTGNP